MLNRSANDGTPVLPVAVGNVQYVPSPFLIEVDFEQVRVEHSLPTFAERVPSNPVFELFDAALPQDAYGADGNIGSKATAFVRIRRDLITDLRCQHSDIGRESGSDADHEGTDNVPKHYFAKREKLFHRFPPCCPLEPASERHTLVSVSELVLGGVEVILQLARFVVVCRAFLHDGRFVADTAFFRQVQTNHATVSFA